MELIKDRIINKVFIPILCLIALMSCSGNSSDDGRSRGIYYWRTSFALNDAEGDFLKEHDVDKIYVKFFDVEKDWKAAKGDAIIPIATMLFKDSIPPGVEIVPTIYITTQAMEAMQLLEDEYADKIIRRVNAMCRRNGITYNEIQLDCDWTKSTREYFFKLCEEIKRRLEPTQKISSTIRLHQLLQSPPPVDKGVLMVYNTGNLMEMTTDNSIFSRKDIEPYLRDDRLAKYTLPLDVAYPTYGWSITFHPGKDKYYFYRILRQTDFKSSPVFKKIGNNMYEATEDVSLDTETRIYKGYRVRVERPSANEILGIKSLIDNQLKDKPHANIIYHLDESQLSHYSDNEINKIYSCN